MRDVILSSRTLSLSLSLCSCCQVYAVLAGIESCAGLPANAADRARPLREPVHRRSAARLAVDSHERGARPVGVTVVVSPHGASCSGGGGGGGAAFALFPILGWPLWPNTRGECMRPAAA